MHRGRHGQQRRADLVMLLVPLLCCRAAAAGARVVQLVAENPSPFVSADPNDPKFIVSLFDDEEAASLLPEAAHTRSTLMTNAAGQQFNCSIPSSPRGAAPAAFQLDADMTPAYDLVKSPFELLESLDGMCLYRQDGLWTYEVCHREQVRQFRQVSLQPGQVITLPLKGAGSGDQAVVDGLVDALLAGDVATVLGGVGSLLESGKKAEDFSCGRYTGDERQSESILEDLSSSGHPLKYVSHRFSGGASCVLTGRPRTAEVRYTCMRGSQENVVLSVREFPTCNYVVVVSTPFLCKHPSFELPEEDIRVMACVPVDSQSSMDSRAATHSKASATDTADTAALSSGQADEAAGAGSGDAAAALQKRLKRPQGDNRSPDYAEAADEGEELLLRLQPQHSDEQRGDYYQGDYMPMQNSDQEAWDNPAVEEALLRMSIQQQEEEEKEREGTQKQDKGEQQQQQQQQEQAVKDGAAGARDEL